MICERIIDGITDLAEGLGLISNGSEWYLFGSVSRCDPDASDIDLIILCRSDAQADALRQAINLDCLALPLDLGLMTFDEAAQVDAIRTQGAWLIYPRTSTSPSYPAF